MPFSSVIFRLPRLALGLLLGVSVAGLGGCGAGSPQRVGLVPIAASEMERAVQLSRDVTASLPSGVVVTLASGSQWRRTGAIVQGDVYRPLAGAFTIPLPRQTEANLVSLSGKLVGFYLPSNGTYIALPRPVVLPVPQRQ